MKNLRFSILSLFIITLAGCEIEEVFLPPEPSVRIVSPLDKSSVVDTVLIQVEAFDDKGILQVRLFIDGKPATNGLMLYEPYEYRWDIRSLQDSSVHEIYAVAMDIDSNQSQSATVKVVAFSFTPADLYSRMIGDTIVRLTWKDASTIETGFQVLETVNDSGYVIIRDLPPNTTSVDLQKIYYSNYRYGFKVRAVAGTKKSFETQEQFAWPTLLPPDSLRVTSYSDSSVTITWFNSNTIFSKRFEVEMSVNNGPYRVMAHLPAGARTVTIDTVFTANTIHRFRIRWFSDYNTSPYSPLISTSISFPAPTQLVAEQIVPAGIRLSWKDNTSFETGFRIERKGSNEAQFAPIDSVPANTVSWDDLTADTTLSYEYRVRAYTSRNNSGFSSTITVSYVPGFFKYQTIDAHPNSIVGIRFLPNDSRLVSVDEAGIVKTWNAANGSMVSQFSTVVNNTACMAVSPDGATVALGGSNGTIRLYSIAGANLIATLTGHTLDVTSMEFNAASTRLVSGGVDSTVIVWNLQTGLSLHTFPNRSSWISAVSYNPVQDVIAYATGDYRVKAIQMSPETELWSKFDTLIHTTSLQYSHDGSMLAVGRKGNSNPLQLFLSDGLIKNPYPFFAYGITQVSFSSDDSLMVTAGIDGNVRAYFTVINNPLLNFAAGIGELTSSVFSTDRAFVATASSNGKIQVWFYRKYWQKI